MNEKLGTMMSLWYKESQLVLDCLKKIKKEIFAPKVSEMGWNYPSNEGHLDAMKRNLVISAAAKAGDKE